MNLFTQLMQSHVQQMMTPSMSIDGQATISLVQSLPTNRFHPDEISTLDTRETLKSQSSPVALDVTREGYSVPTDLWAPNGETRGIVLACHGGSGHKRSRAVLAIADSATRLGLAVLAIDGPVHGERRGDGDLTPQTAIGAFRQAWRDGVGSESIGLDFSASLDVLLGDVKYQGLPVGYIGVSMGTAYGIPLLARDLRIAAAVIGLWGTTYLASGHLAGIARDIRCPVWFTQQWNDEIFDRQGTFELFDAVGSTDKRLVAYPGPHRELEGHRLAEAIAFLEVRLAKQHEASSQD